MKKTSYECDNCGDTIEGADMVVISAGHGDPRHNRDPVARTDIIDIPGLDVRTSGGNHGTFHFHPECWIEGLVDIPDPDSPYQDTREKNMQNLRETLEDMGYL